MRQFKMICVITLAILCMVGMAYATPKGTVSDPDSKEVIKINDFIFDIEYQNEFSGSISERTLNQKPVFLFRGKSFHDYLYVINKEELPLVFVIKPHENYPENGKVELFALYHRPNVILHSKNESGVYRIADVAIVITISLGNGYIDEKNIGKYLKTIFDKEKTWKLKEIKWESGDLGLIPLSILLELVPVSTEPAPVPDVKLH